MSLGLASFACTTAPSREPSSAVAAKPPPSPAPVPQPAKGAEPPHGSDAGLAAFADLERHPVAQPTGQATLTADTDPSRVRDGVAAVPTDGASWCTALAGPNATCRILAHGPLRVTDVISTRADCQGQAIVVLRNSKVRLRLNETATLRSTRLQLVEGDVLVLVQELAAAAANAAGAAVPAKTVSDIEQPDVRHSCGVYWSGYAPYGTRPAPPVELQDFLTEP